MIKIYSAYNNEVVDAVDSQEMLDKWITDRAYAWNYGLFRTWSMDGRTYYDLSRTVVYTVN